MMQSISPSRILVLVILFSSAINHALAQVVADPTQLQTAARQTPDWIAYNALGILAAPANTYYLDPVTGVRVTKITSPTVPEVNTWIGHDYSEGGPHISMAWDGVKHTVLLHSSSGTPWLADYQYGVGVSNYWAFPAGQPRPQDDLSASFSNVSANARILFFVATDLAAPHAAKLYRFNTATHSVQGDALMPAGFVTIMPGAPGAVWNGLNWLQTSRDDRWIVMQGCVQAINDPSEKCLARTVYAYDRLNARLHSRTCNQGLFRCRDLARWDADLQQLVYCDESTWGITPCDTFDDTSDMDEPHLDRNGTYVQLLDGGGKQSLGGGQFCGDGQPVTPTFERNWHRWQLKDLPANDVVVCKKDLYGGHIAWVRGNFANVDPDPNSSPNFYYTPAANPASDIVFGTNSYSAANAFRPDHQAGQWIQPEADITQWVWGSNTQGDGVVKPTAWGLDTGQVYHSQSSNCDPEFPLKEICWEYETYALAQQGQLVAYQAEVSDPDHMGLKLVRMTSLPLTAPGQFYYNPTTPPAPGTHELYVWAFGGGNPLNRVFFSTPTPVHWGIGVRRLNGSDVRLLCHDYSWSAALNPDGTPDTGRNYASNPFATTSPDGKLVMFKSNMGKRRNKDEPPNESSERVDVFIAEVPRINLGGGGGGGCGAAPQEGALAPPHCQ